MRLFHSIARRLQLFRAPDPVEDNRDEIAHGDWPAAPHGFDWIRLPSGFPILKKLDGGVPTPRTFPRIHDRRRTP